MTEETDEAREAFRAFRALCRANGYSVSAAQTATYGYAQGWDARGQHDEQRIAALVEAVIWMSGSADFAPGGQAHEHWGGIRDGVLARALAGSEESGDDEQRSDAASL